ncbi:MAG: sigma-70 family RNA polymerase sigma factor [Prevotella sp.]|mgnify:FL=1|nr:sigma-70 family RNA polymerase sigma factor [Prevotella sp.]MCF0208566.1 sigma-70 family RNA polymerase sigma factor [Bacteroidaceae bacterium]
MKTISFQNDILPMKDLLFRLALRITLNREDAEDVVQETLIRCWNKRDEWENIDSVQAFATTICRNLAVDCTKRAGRKTTALNTSQIDAQPDSNSLTSSPLQKVIRQERLELLQQIVNHLPENQKLCLQLRDFEEKSYKEIAEMLQITEQQVKTNIFRARQTIKKSFIDNP